MSVIPIIVCEECGSYKVTREDLGRTSVFWKIWDVVKLELWIQGEQSGMYRCESCKHHFKVRDPFRYSRINMPDLKNRCPSCDECSVKLADNNYRPSEGGRRELYRCSECGYEWINTVEEDPNSVSI